MKVIGIKKAVMTSGKNEGKTGYTYYFEKDFSDYDIENSVCEGKSVTQEFSYTDFGVQIGDEVQAVYEKGFQDKAVLVNLVPFPKNKA